MRMNYQDILEKVLSVLKEHHENSIIGFLPPLGGIAISCAGGDVNTDFAGNAFINMRLSVAAKSETQQGCVELIDNAHSAFNRMDIDGDTYHIYCGQITAMPQLAAQDAHGMWILTSNVRVKALSERSE